MWHHREGLAGACLTLVTASDTPPSSPGVGTAGCPPPGAEARLPQSTPKPFAHPAPGPGTGPPTPTYVQLLPAQPPAQPVGQHPLGSSQAELEGAGVAPTQCHAASTA